MKAMRPLILVVIAVAAALVGWLATSATNRFSMPTPVLPESALVTMGVIALLTLVMGVRVLRWRNGKKKAMLDPHAASWKITASVFRRPDRISLCTCLIV